MVKRLAAAYDVVRPSRAELDFTKAADVRAAVAAAHPDVIVNCAAYNFVDAAEDEVMEALAVNAWGPRLLARAAEETGAVLVHFSTDFVFDGRASQPYTETDPPRPQSTYAISKLCGEWLVRESPRHYILRVESLFGGARAKGSVDQLLSAIMTGREARAFSDRIVSPSYVDDVARATEALIGQLAPFGLYHCVNGGATTWLELARELARLAGRPDAVITPVAVADVPLRAPRPKYAALSNDKLRGVGIEMPSWQNALERYVNLETMPGNVLRKT